MQTQEYHRLKIYNILYNSSSHIKLFVAILFILERQDTQWECGMTSGKVASGNQTRHPAVTLYVSQTTQLPGFPVL